MHRKNQIIRQKRYNLKSILQKAPKCKLVFRLIKILNQIFFKIK
jgi:hypothetical protein